MNKLYTSINEYKKSLKKNKCKKINENIPFEHEIRNVFPDIDSQELRTMFYGLEEERDIDEIKEIIEDDIKWMFEELENDGIDYTKLSQTEFMNEFEKRALLSEPNYEYLYKIIFKELITDPNQLEFKFESLKHILNKNK